MIRVTIRPRQHAHGHGIALALTIDERGRLARALLTASCMGLVRAHVGPCGHSARNMMTRTHKKEVHNQKMVKGWHYNWRIKQQLATASIKDDTISS